MPIKKLSSSLILLISLSVAGRSQAPVFTATDSAFFAAYEDTLQFYLEEMFNSKDVNDRVAYNYGVIPRLVRALKHPNSFHYPFDSLFGIEIVASPDSTFRTLTWELELQKKQYRHFGAIQMNTPELKMFPLTDASDAILNPEMAVLPDSLWFGMLYYNIIQRDVDGQRYYFLFGFDRNDALSSLKFVDVLTFPNGKPQFGAQVFEVKVKGETRTLSRFRLQYSNEAVASLNYFDDYGKIIYDHVAPSNPNSVGAYFLYIPDGTYEGFEWKDGKWVWIENVFTETQDSPPFPIPLDFKLEGER